MYKLKIEHMKTTFLLILIFFFTISCKKNVKIKTNKTEVELIEVIDEGPGRPIDISPSDTLGNSISDWRHPDFFEFKNYKEYKITDTINIDLNGNGILESVYFEDKDCPKLLIKEQGQELISLGCGNKEYKGFPNAIGWVDLWCVVSDKKAREVLFTENGDIDKDTIVNLERPSIYIGKKEAGGGVITYRNGKLYWIQQSD